MVNWKKHIEKINLIISNLLILNENGKELNIDEGFNILVNKLIEIKEGKKNLFVIGNGASASMASHFSADLAKNAKMKTMVFTDQSLITAMGNDEGYDKVYSEPLKIWAEKSDCLFTISSSGNSPNIVNAVKYAKINNIFTITLSAMKKNNYSRSNGDINIYIPADTYGNAEVIHALILHYLTDLVILKIEDFK